MFTKSSNGQLMKVLPAIFLTLIMISCSKDKKEVNNSTSTPISPFNYNSFTNFEYAAIQNGDTTTLKSVHLVDTVSINGESRLVVYGDVHSCDTGHYVFNQNFIQLKYDNNGCGIFFGRRDTSKFRYNPASNLYPWNLPKGTIWQSEYKWSMPIGMDTYQRGVSFIDYQVTNREFVTTPAGTFDCIVSTSSDISTRIYTSTFGLVKSENYDSISDTIIAEFLLVKVY